MKIDRKWGTIVFFVLIIIFTITYLLLYPPSDGFNRLNFWPIAILFSFVALVIIGSLFVNEENEKNIKSKITNIAAALLIIAGGKILGIELHTIWGYVIAFVIIYIMFEYVIIRLWKWIRKKTMNLNVKVEHNVSKRLKKRHNN